MNTKQVTKNAYRKRLIKAAQAVEAHAFGESVSVRSMHSEIWEPVPADWNRADLMCEYRIEQGLNEVPKIEE